MLFKIFRLKKILYTNILYLKSRDTGDTNKLNIPEMNFNNK
jgi:hypothetical protein